MSKQANTISAINLAQFIAEKTDRNLFLTGKAGTGKTVFLKEFKEHLKSASNLNGNLNCSKELEHYAS